MRLSFQFQDFFRHRSTGTDGLSDIKAPTFLVQHGVLGDLKVQDLEESLLNDEEARIEVDLEGSSYLGMHRSVTNEHQASCTPSSTPVFTVIQSFVLLSRKR